MSQESRGSKSRTKISLPSIIAEQNEHRGGLIARSPDSLAAIEKAAAALQEQIEQQRTERKQERFFWFFAVSSLLNVIFFSLAPWLAASCFLLFSLVGLIGLAKWLEVPWVVTHLTKMLNLAHKANGDKGTE